MKEEKRSVLLARNRKVTELQKHFLLDMSRLFPSVVEGKASIEEVRELAEMNDCKFSIYAERKRSLKLYLIAKKCLEFEIVSITTMKTLQSPVNCFRETGILLSFTKDFDEREELVKTKNMLSEMFPKAENEVDKMISFYYLDDKIWMRIYKIEEDKSLKELGPRIVLSFVKEF